MTTVPNPEAITTWYDAYVFDLDGTIYLGDELLPGARELIDTLRQHEIPVRFLSNNPTKSPHMYVEKLAGLGIDAPIETIANTVVTMTRWLQTHHPGATVFPIAEAPLVEALDAAGIRMSSDPTEIDIVIASYDRAFTYDKLQIAFDAIWFHRRAILVATNPDRYCPFPGGRGEPDCAAIIAAIEACTGVTCDTIVGKPNPITIHESLRGLDIPFERCVMVGDRLGTDIKMAVNTGMKSALVLTGDSDLADVETCDPGDRPTWIIERIDDLIPVNIRPT
ncbi:HAD-IIA family hydrolase [Stomatohabitans albus]|uniref:HAD-IIA family hydrolase n=1 Tax=Stomatohabitans albus TaxID=3110766 RepID=UPI00300D6E0B